MKRETFDVVTDKVFFSPFPMTTGRGDYSLLSVNFRACTLLRITMF